MKTTKHSTPDAPTEASGGKPAKAASACEGKFVSLTGNKLVMTSTEGKEFTHTLAKDAKVSCDGAACKPEDLKAGRKIRVTTKKEDRSVATGIESLNKHTQFAQSCA